MAVYGITPYGEQTYGYFIPPVYRIDPFIAAPYDYENIQITWNKPSGTILAYRLIKNMYGFPVDQDDGEILLDVTSGYPGGSFTDSSIVPGAYHYYGFYVLINSATDEWVRAGMTGCLMLNNYGSAGYMENLIPNFYINAINAQNELVKDPVGNTFIDKFMEVAGWGMDYLRTQYDTYQNVNNPWTIPINNLYAMGAQFNININPDIHPYTLRKAIFYNAIVNELRGTTSGIATELTALTGWNANITIGPNILLNNDQSYCADPSFNSWSANLAYTIGEYVQFGNFWYVCIAGSNQGNAPTGTSSSNTWWQAVLSTVNSVFLANQVTGGVSTWEAVYPLLTNGTFTVPSPAIVQHNINSVTFTTGTSATVTTTFGSNITAGNCIVAFVSALTPGPSSVSSVTTNGLAENWTLDTSNPPAYAYVNPNSGGGTTVVHATVGFGATATSSDSATLVLEIYEISRMLTSGVIDQSSNNVSGSNSWSSGPAGPTTQASELWMGFTSVFFNATSGQTITGPPSPWNNQVTTNYTRKKNGSTVFYSQMSGYQFASAIGSATYSGTASAVANWNTLAITLKTVAPAVVPPTVYEVLGVADPLNTSDFAFNSLGAKNITGSSTDIWIRSIARTTTDLQTVTTTFAPDKYQGMADGIPIPYIGFNEAWSPLIEYSPENIVTFNNQPFLALRASKNSMPPYSSPGASNQDWAPLSFNDRFRLCVSAYETASSAVTVTPFVEWYDAGGNYIMRVFARNPVGGSVNIPNQLAFDSFVTAAGTTIASRTTDDGGNSWIEETGAFSVSPFAGGCTYPATTGTRSVAVVNAGIANCQVGLTFITSPDAGKSVGLNLRYQDNNNYLRADQSTLRMKNAGVWSTLGTFSTAFSEGDRMLVQMNGSSIVVLRNNVSVLSVTQSFNSSVTNHGIVYEVT